MKRFKKGVKIAVIASAGVLLLALAAFVIGGRMINPYPTEEKIEKEFYKNYETIARVSEYMLEAPYANISVYRADYLYSNSWIGYWYATNRNPDLDKGGFIRIESDDIVEDVTFLLKKRKYQTIDKGRNIIRIQMYSDEQSSKGLAYAPEGELTLKDLSKAEELEGGWYYYETESAEATERTEK